MHIHFFWRLFTHKCNCFIFFRFGICLIFWISFFITLCLTGHPFSKHVFFDSCFVVKWELLKQLKHSWHLVVITTAQLHSTKPVHRFCAGSNPARGMSKICDSEDLWQWSWLEISLKRLLLVNHTTKRIHHHRHHHQFACLYKVRFLKFCCGFFNLTLVKPVFFFT